MFGLSLHSRFGAQSGGRIIRTRTSQPTFVHQLVQHAMMWRCSLHRMDLPNEAGSPCHFPRGWSCRVCSSHGEGGSGRMVGLGTLVDRCPSNVPPVDFCLHDVGLFDYVGVPVQVFDGIPRRRDPFAMLRSRSCERTLVPDCSHWREEAQGHGCACAHATLVPAAPVAAKRALRAPLAPAQQQHCKPSFSTNTNHSMCLRLRLRLRTENPIPVFFSSS